MNAALADIEAEANRIEDAAEQIEQALMAVDDAESWRYALGFVEAASRRLYELRRAMLNTAVRRTADREWRNDEGRSAEDSAATVS